MRTLTLTKVLTVMSIDLTVRFAVSCWHFEFL